MSNENLEKKLLNEEELNNITGGEKDKIKCPHCKKSVSVNLSNPNAKCPHCGKKVFS